MKMKEQLKRILIILLVTSFGITMSEAGVRIPGFQDLGSSDKLSQGGFADE